MTSDREYGDYLADMKQAASDAREFVHSLEFDEFLLDRRTQLAVVKCLEILGEAAKKIPVDMRSRYPDFPWGEAAGMRDKLVHEYFGVDLRVVWRTVHEDLPPLESQVDAILRQECG
ncbi:MAG: DUF86 domain-containing protein [Actinobacteria bacterium]|nr:DUF86 domain-containing protein [Actinomycetota bacterium]